MSLWWSWLHGAHTVDGRNPKQPPGMVLKPCKEWDKLPISSGDRRISNKVFVKTYVSSSEPHGLTIFIAAYLWPKSQQKNYEVQIKPLVVHLYICIKIIFMYLFI